MYIYIIVTYIICLIPTTNILCLILRQAHLIICCEVALDASELRHLAHYEGVT